jgi:hypothetical protein
LSAGDFREALPALLGPDAAGLSSSAILRLTKTWTTEYKAFRRRDLADREYVYLCADGVHFTIRLEEERLCALVLIGVRPDDTKEVAGLEDGYRERGALAHGAAESQASGAAGVASLTVDQDRLLRTSTTRWNTGSISARRIRSSPFATVRLREAVTKGAGSRTAGLVMAFKLLQVAEGHRRTSTRPSSYDSCAPACISKTE